MSAMDWASENGPILVWMSEARTAKWYLCPLWNCVSVQAMGSGSAFTSPTFFHGLETGASDISWYAKIWNVEISAWSSGWKSMFQDRMMPAQTETRRMV